MLVYVVYIYMLYIQVTYIYIYVYIYIHAHSRYPSLESFVLLILCFLEFWGSVLRVQATLHPSRTGPLVHQGPATRIHEPTPQQTNITKHQRLPETTWTLHTLNLKLSTPEVPGASVWRPNHPAQRLPVRESYSGSMLGLLGFRSSV